MRGSSLTEKAIQDLCGLMHLADRDAEFAFELWNGQTIKYGSHPRVILCLKTEQSAKDLLRKGFLGFGEAYMSGDLHDLFLRLFY